MKTSTSILLVALLLPLAVGCENKGPAERAGAKIDEATQKVQDAAKDASENVKDAAEDAGDKVKDATN